MAFQPGPGCTAGQGGKLGGGSTEDKDSGKASLPGPLHTSREIWAGSELRYRHVHLEDTPSSRVPSHLGKAFPFAVTRPFWSDDPDTGPKKQNDGPSAQEDNIFTIISIL